MHQNATEQAEANKRTDLLRKADYQQLMESKAGRGVFYRMLSDCGVYRTSFSPDALVMAYQEGRRSVGLKILADLQRYCPAECAQMINEGGESNE